MADIFADLVAMASIDMVKFNQQLDSLKQKLQAAGAITITPDGEGVKDINKAVQEIDSNVKDATKSMGNFHNDSGKASNTVEKVAQKTKQVGVNAQQASSQMEMMAMAVAKVFAALGAIEAGLKGIAAFGDLINGDIESAVENLKSLPFGLGSIADATERVYNAFSRTDEKLEEMRLTTEALSKSFREGAEEFERALGTSINNAQELKQLEMQIRLERAKGAGDEDAVDRIQAEIAANQRLFDIRSRINEINNEIIDQESGALTVENLEGEEISLRERRERMKELREEISEFENELRGLQDALNSIDVNQIGGGAARTGVEMQIIAITRQLKEARDELRDTEELDETRKDRVKNLRQELEQLNKIQEKLKVLNEVERENAEIGIVDRANREALEAEEEKLRAAEERIREIQREEEKAARERERLRREEQRMEEEQTRNRIAAIQRVARLRSSIIQQQLLLQGNNVEAQIEGIQQRFREAFAQAEGLQERFLLVKKLALDIVAARKQAEETDGSRESIFSRFEDTVARLALGDREAKIQREAEKAARRDEQRNESLKELIQQNGDIRDILKRKPGIAVFG